METTKLEENELKDEQTAHAWEDLRVEVLHEIQDGGIAEVPDTVIDQLGELVVEIDELIHPPAA